MGMAIWYNVVSFLNLQATVRFANVRAQGTSCGAWKEKIDSLLREGEVGVQNLGKILEICVQ